MNDMWITLIPIMVKYGLDFAMSLWTKIQAGKDPTPADWVELKAIVGGTSEQELHAAVDRAGLDWNSPQVLQLRQALCPSCFITVP